MAEYIEREAVKAKAMIGWVMLGFEDDVVTVDDIDSIPAADVAPVVRCKDCVMHGNCLTEDTFLIAMIENPFCCGGKRKDGGKDG